MRIFLALALITLPMGVDAATPHKTQHYKRPVVHRVQQHYSFIPPRQASVIMPKSVESTPLTGQVQQINHTVETVKQPYCSALAMPVSDQSIPASRKHFSPLKSLWKQRIVATPSQSAAIPMNATEAAQLSSAATDMIASLNKTNSPIFLLPAPKTNNRADTFTPSLIHTLQNAGFRISSETNEQSTPVRYRVSNYQNSYMIHITVKSTHLARLFKVIDGTLIAASPLSSTQEHP